MKIEKLEIHTNVLKDTLGLEAILNGPPELAGRSLDSMHPLRRHSPLMQ